MRFRGMTLSSSSQWWLPVGRKTSGNEQKGTGITCIILFISKQRARVKANIARIHILEMGTQRPATLCSKLFCIQSFNKYSMSIYYVPGPVLGSQDIGTQRNIPVLMKLIVSVWNMQNSLVLFLTHEYNPWSPHEKRTAFLRSHPICSIFSSPEPPTINPLTRLVFPR